MPQNSLFIYLDLYCSVLIINNENVSEFYLKGTRTGTTCNKLPISAYADAAYHTHSQKGHVGNKFNIITWEFLFGFS